MKAIAPVPKNFDLPGLEREIAAFWVEQDVERLYLERNQHAPERFSFIDGPITANGPMGVHHAWGRTYKDLWQRYHTMLGKRQRYQNGFDCQGLWVEVTVERRLGFTSKRDIETYGIDQFVRRCKECVYEFADMQTRQSRRLGYFMDWNNSYYTLSDENNYTIWRFLKTCHQRGLLYRGTDVMPWCTRCGTGLSEHEIATEGYQELTHRSVFVKFPLDGKPGESLLVWTTTPWTLTSNVAVAVNPDLAYARVLQGGQVFYVAEAAVSIFQSNYQVLETVLGNSLVGWTYRGPFDELDALRDIEHVVIPWEDVSADEGTGLVHIAPGCGKEDFALGKLHGLGIVAPVDQSGVYVERFGWLSGQNVREVAPDIIANLRDKGLLYRDHDYTHRYPVCWRCGTQLVFRLVDEWFISMEPLRAPMMEVARQITWLPPYGLERELDWLRNMDDWMISKKRYWGLALPFWLCDSGHLNVVGSKEELSIRAIGRLDQLESPHRPWLDKVEIRCGECGERARRILDVGNPWLDAGIVPFSTLGYVHDRDYWSDWFPADFITESFPGQFRNWFYSMLAMSTVLENRPPFMAVLGYASMSDQSGREMHKSWGNLIPFDDAAERAGADAMRWLFCHHVPDSNLNFGWQSLDEVKRKLLVLWNTYSFFVTYAIVDGWDPDSTPIAVPDRPDLDRWALSRAHQLASDVRSGLESFDPVGPARAIENFIEDLSTWYVRRSRRRFWKSENDEDKQAAYHTLYECLNILTRLLAPFLPHVSEALYQNLVRGTCDDGPVSVHLTDFPIANLALVDTGLVAAMDAVRRIVSLGRAARDRAGVKVRQPLQTLHVALPASVPAGEILGMQELILAELNVKCLVLTDTDEDFVTYKIRPNLARLGPRCGGRVTRIGAALKELDPSVVASSVRNRDVIRIELGDEEITLRSDDVLISAVDRAGFAAMGSDGYVVALDTNISEPLKREGQAREVVRRINEWRKQAGLRVEDHIRLTYAASPSLSRAIEEHASYIAQEVLAVELINGRSEGSGTCMEARFGDDWLQIRFERA